MTRTICAVVPIKETAQAKQRLTGIRSEAERRALALAMAEDVLSTLALVPELAGILVATADPAAVELARRYGARVSAERAREGHTAAVTAAARRLAAESIDMLALPGDIPLVEPGDIRRLLAAHRPSPAFSIVPARDELGSNAVLCSPADMVPLRFGENSFFPHLAAARAHGIAPTVIHLPRIALDIDTPDDLARFLAVPSHTRTRALLDRPSVRANGATTEFEKTGA
jgi:2-phospho-L-lactate/phosphoenolpyruvate guanylyltransferase